MSADFHVKIKCKMCYGKTIKHLCATDPAGMYTVTCTECGRTPIRGVTEDKMKELVQELGNQKDFIGNCVIPE